MRTPRVTVAAFLLIAAAALTGCAAKSADTTPTRLTEAPTTAPVEVDEIATYLSNGASMQAGLRATLIRKDGCLYTGTATYETDGVPLTLMVFPRHATTWDGTTLTVGDESWEVGETVELGGGLIREPNSPYELDSSITVPSACVITDEVWLVGSPQEVRQ
jgi:hypothetical protein